LLILPLADSAKYTIEYKKTVVLDLYKYNTLYYVNT